MDGEKPKPAQETNSKQQQLDQFRVTGQGKAITTNQGKKLSNTVEQLKAGERGPSLLQDYEYFEKMTHFTHEEMPERVVHARGYGAHGEFECYQPMGAVTQATFLQTAGKKTPVFTRFSTVQGSRGSYDTARDLRCLGVKFYTDEGNYDLTSIAMPVLINNDAMKFPDAMHAYQSKQDIGIPTASGAHDHFWDYVANNEEALHMVIWIMSDRGLIKNYRTMESWAINTYLFINDQGAATFVRFVWKPMLGVQTLLMEEAMHIGGIDPDYHRRDLREAIDAGAFPEYELGVQLIPMEQEFDYDFDVLDPTKFWPEEVIPVQRIGKMTLNRNVDNEFAELEQVAFNPANVVPGIDFSNDPVLQGRLIAYQTAQYHRFGSANFQNLPINRPLCPFHNHTRRGTMRERIDLDAVNYTYHALIDQSPHETKPAEGGFASYSHKVEGYVTRGRSPSFTDYYTQPRIFWNSMTSIEREHIIEAFSYQLGRVKNKSVREKNVKMLAHVDKVMACRVADNIGVAHPEGTQVSTNISYPSLSIQSSGKSPSTQKVGVLIGNGFNSQKVVSLVEYLKKHGVFVVIISDKLQALKGNDGFTLAVAETYLTTSPYLMDALYLAGGDDFNLPTIQMNISKFTQTAFQQYKPIGVAAEALHILAPAVREAPGVISEDQPSTFKEAFINAISQQRFWDRNKQLAKLI